MAGSYKHVTTNSGHLRSDTFADMIENLGDAFEAVEELYGMVWWLAATSGDPVAAIEQARQEYKIGLGYAEVTLDANDEYRDDDE